MRSLMLSLAAVGLMGACAPMDPGAGHLPADEEPTQCRVDQYRHLVGQNRSALPQPPAGENWRVYCTTCAVTMDYKPSRLNIVFDEATGVIREVKCG
jgi:hypothetical protein